MRPDYLEYRDWECLKYCQTQENCYCACGLEAPRKEENNTFCPQTGNDSYSVTFVMNKETLQNRKRKMICV